MTMRPSRKPAVGFIFITYVLVVLGFGVLIPVLPKLVTEFRGSDVAAGAHAYGVLVGVFALMQFLVAPALGALSDQFGRRPVILLSLAGSAVDYLIMGFEVDPERETGGTGWLVMDRTGKVNTWDGV